LKASADEDYDDHDYYKEDDEDDDNEENELLGQGSFGKVN